MLDGEFARRSLQSMLGHVSPMRFDENWRATSQNRPRNRVAMGCVKQGQGHLQHRGDQLGLRGQQQAQRDRQRQHPLPHRHVWDDVVDKVRRSLRHPARAARETEPTPLAAERQRLVVAALAAAQPQEAVGLDTALEDGVDSHP